MHRVYSRSTTLPGTRRSFEYADRDLRFELRDCPCDHEVVNGGTLNELQDMSINSKAALGKQGRKFDGRIVQMTARALRLRTGY
jgi:hypothetical protein